MRATFVGTGGIINEVRGINRVLYDVTSKSPGTIEMSPMLRAGVAAFLSTP
jgi:hypothetical protein